MKIFQAQPTAERPTAPSNVMNVAFAVSVARPLTLQDSP